MQQDVDILIIGGGLAGLVSSILLARQGRTVCLIEQKTYPFHRVCGEYISNEVRPFLEREGLFPEAADPARITQFELTATNGKQAEMPLDLGAFGISRYYLDAFLVEKAEAAGVKVMSGEKVVSTESTDSCFSAQLASGEWVSAEVGVAAYGKRTRLDKDLKRPFMNRRSPYLGVKYHIKTDFPSDRIVLHNFPGGYCGLSKVEGDTYNLCYLASRDHFKPFKGIRPAEEAILFQNPFLHSVFRNSDFLFDKPLVINEISFAPKAAVEEGIFMCGDAAGLITPLCGNGMAMAIHGAWLLSESMRLHWPVGGSFQRKEAEAHYARAWARTFKARLWAGRQIQRLFGSVNVSPLAVATVKHARPVASFLMRQTHGKGF